MKRKTIACCLGLLFSMKAFAQIPYFAPTVGDGKMYAYTSLKVRPGINRQETYTTFQYGLGDHFATGADLYTGQNCAYWGALIRYGLEVSQWFNIGAEVIPSFDLNNSFKFAYLSSALYLNGAISRNKRLFWCTNTWWVVNRDKPFTLSNYEYLAYTIPLKKQQSLIPMVGTIHAWLFDQDLDLAAGCYYSIKNWNIYVWGNDYLKSHPRFIVGVDYTF